MSAPLWVIETAESFWELAGEPEPFPRSLRRPIAQVLPLTVVLLPMLGVHEIEQWLQGQNVLCYLNTDDRRLRACLVARFGHGIIFIDGADPHDEQRLSLAHELAHFLLDYWHPRGKAIEHLGSAIVDVLDGVRLPQVHERTHAVLSGINVGYHVHLMMRTPFGDPASAAIVAAEDKADRLAFELLAPYELVAREVASLPPDERQQGATLRLVNVYGFPLRQATQYAHLLTGESRPSDSLLRRLGLRP